MDVRPLICLEPPVAFGRGDHQTAVGVHREGRNALNALVANITAVEWSDDDHGCSFHDDRLPEILQADEPLWVTEVPPFPPACERDADNPPRCGEKKPPADWQVTHDNHERTDH
jgi:hypothetical protein